MNARYTSPTALSWVLATMLLSACASETALNNTQNQPAFKTGIVESVKAIDMPKEQRAAGYFFGGTLGNIGGAVIGGGGRGSAAGAVLGSVAGATAGDRAQNSGVVAGQEIWVQIDGQREPIVVSQTIKLRGAFQVGDRVRVLYGARKQVLVEPIPAGTGTQPH